MLPLLYADRFIARIEPGREKGAALDDGAPAGPLVIKNWWWEPDVGQSDRMRADVIACSKAFLFYLNAEELAVNKAAARREKLGWLVRAFS